jgi:predicted Zn-dependent peptidase
MQYKEIDSLIKEEDFNRIKKMIYAEYVKSFNSVDGISTGVLMNYFKGINSFDYIEEFSSFSLEDVQNVLGEVFLEEQMVLSVINKK